MIASDGKAKETDMAFLFGWTIVILLPVFLAIPILTWVNYRNWERPRKRFRDRMLHEAHSEEEEIK